MDIKFKKNYLGSSNDKEGLALPQYQILPVVGLNAHRELAAQIGNWKFGLLELQFSSFVVGYNSNPQMWLSIVVGSSIACQTIEGDKYSKWVSDDPKLVYHWSKVDTYITF